MTFNTTEKKLIEIIETFQAEFWRVSDAIWGYAELGLEEYRSSALLMNTLEEKGFKIKRNVAQMPTAFVASWQNGSGKPVIGLTAEYDALPELSQKKGVPVQEALIQGAPGHGCGHNTMAATQALAAVALQRISKECNLDVTLKYFGCPAEELLVSRPYMIQDGVFEDVDLVIDCHADCMFKTIYGKLGNALFSLMYTYQGKSSHAAWKPWNGRSAADAVELLHAGTERMREHVKPSNRIHWVTTFSGQAPNTVPEKAETWYYLRGDDENMDSITAWVNDCAKGAALMTQTSYKTKTLAAVHQRFYNKRLAETLYGNMKRLGNPLYTDEESTFALTLQKEAGFPEVGMEYPLTIVNAEEDEPRASSSDVGDVCLVVPTGQISVPVWVPGTPAHNWTATSAGATSIAHKGISAAAKAISLTAYMLITDPNRVEEIKNEFKQLQKERPYHSFLPEDVTPCFGFYSDIMDTYREKLASVGDSFLDNKG